MRGSAHKGMSRAELEEFCNSLLRTIADLNNALQKALQRSDEVPVFRIMRRKRLTMPLYADPGDKLELSYTVEYEGADGPAHSRTKVLEENVTDYCRFDEAAIFELQDSLGYSMGGMFIDTSKKKRK